MPRARKLPSREEVVRLYVADGLSTPEIARRFGISDPHAVRVQLLRAGVVLRHHTVRKVCVIDGCGKSVTRTLHKGNGSMYGNRCADHQKQHRKKVTSECAARFRREHPEIVKQRYDAWITRLRGMSPEQLIEEIKDKPCQFKKAELLRKIRQINRTGRYGEAIQAVLKAFPMFRPERASRAPIR